MKKFKKRFASGVVALTIVGALAACSSDESVDEDAVEPDTDAGGEETDDDVEGDTSTATEGGDLRLAMMSDAVDLDPHGSNDTSSSHVRTNIYERLVNHDENMDLIPELAESFEQVDELTWEFVLREDVTFTDGEPFNGEAVKRTLERVIDPDVASPKAFMYEMIENIEVIDDYTVEITTEYPFAPLAANLAHDGGGMISPKAIEEEENGERNLILSL
ncbi:ABC transporter substrate-binding protein [Geomicrobium sp. JCM 19038]|uniref:ABC transporter substrate-binding protein n=1 Tax=Geomicrobium sp. JCM 19038 TaxID=1460635 RepID=UPI0006935319|nr:ABC transporter substrate-binding protein [Geomicrobium sp. JCM 19038]